MLSLNASKEVETNDLRSNQDEKTIHDRGSTIDRLEKLENIDRPITLNTEMKVQIQTLEKPFYRDLSFAIVFNEGKNLENQLMSIRVSDPNDPFLLFTKTFRQTEFDELKEKQSLVVSFKKFPFVVHELLESSKKSKESCTRSSHSSGPICSNTCFIVKNSENEITLAFQETSNLKKINLLEITLFLASEESLKENIMDLINGLKKEKNKMNEINTELKSTIDKITVDLKFLKEDLDSVKLQHKREISDLHREHLEELKKLEKRYKDELLIEEEKCFRLNDALDLLKEDLKRSQNEVFDHIQVNKILEDALKLKDRELKDTSTQLEQKDRKLSKEDMKSFYQIKEVEESHRKELAKLKLEYENMIEGLRGEIKQKIVEIDHWKIKFNNSEKISELNRQVSDYIRDNVSYNSRANDYTRGNNLQVQQPYLQYKTTKDQFYKSLNDKRDPLELNVPYTNFTGLGRKKSRSKSREIEDKIDENIRQKDKMSAQMYNAASTKTYGASTYTNQRNDFARKDELTLKTRNLLNNKYNSNR